MTISVFMLTPLLAQSQGKKTPIAKPITNPEGLIKRSGVIPTEIPLQPNTSSDPNAATWERNPHRAFSIAKTKQKPMLLLFTAQWNTLCQQLSSEVFSSKTFNIYAKKNLVLCYLDFPRDPLDIPDALRDLKEKFKIRGLPVLLVFDPNGHVVDQVTGYRSGRPVDYFKKLKLVTDIQLADIAQKRKILADRGYREWINNKGQTFFALFVRRNESSITLKAVSGEKWNLKIKDLSPSDQSYTRSFPSDPPAKHK